MYTALIFKEQIEVLELISQTYYYMQHIEGYDLLCYKDKIYIPQLLRQAVLSWYHEYLLYPSQTQTEKIITQDVERSYSSLTYHRL
jgi:hypothetical protein